MRLLGIRLRKSVRRACEQGAERRGQTDWQRVDAFTDEEIEQFAREEGFDDDEGPLTGRAIIPPGVIPGTDVRSLRESLGLTLDEFARCYGLPSEDVQAWEQHVRKPDGAARTFLWLITLDPIAVAERLALPPLAA
jgi:DNA-binding transcriptional regulator YiaG